MNTAGTTAAATAATLAGGEVLGAAATGIASGAKAIRAAQTAAKAAKAARAAKAAKDAQTAVNAVKPAGTVARMLRTGTGTFIKDYLTG